MEVGTLSDKLCNKSGEVEMNPFIKRSVFYDYIYPWYRKFDSNQILLVDQDELSEDPVRIMKRVEQFLEIPQLLSSENFPYFDHLKFFCFRSFDKQRDGFYVFKNNPNSTDDDVKCFDPAVKAREHEDIPDTLRAKLEDFFKPYNKYLEKLSGQTFKWIK